MKEELDNIIVGWISSAETEIDTDQIHESPVQTKLTMSCLKEYERVTTSFAYLNMQGHSHRIRHTEGRLE